MAEEKLPYSALAAKVEGEEEEEEEEEEKQLSSAEAVWRAI